MDIRRILKYMITCVTTAALVPGVSVNASAAAVRPSASASVTYVSATYASSAAAVRLAAADTYSSPIDFRALRDQNPDIIAWLSVPGTNISYPVCQNQSNDAFYITHNSARAADVNGALFTEHAYNKADFSDPVTVIYGHNMKSGKMFGYLEETFRGGLVGHDSAVIYLPEGEIHYKLFAAMRVPSGHLLDGSNMNMPAVFSDFANSITGNKDMYSVIDRSVKVVNGDRLLVLSTCVGGDASKRYIVAGKRVSEKNTDPARRK